MNNSSDSKRKREIRTCPLGHKTEYNYHPNDTGTIVAVYCPDCMKEYKPEEIKFEIFEED